MRPVTLSMTAFGPYASTVTLDFRELGEKRFFLIHGPTGAGKTSVLDAMTYALYGSTSGDERNAEDMRSQFAAPDLLTQVTFEFSVGDQRYRVWRKPAQDRPKQRGDGFTREHPDAALWCRTACADDTQEGEVVATGVRDVGAKVQELLGFSAEQFRQVVVLPQGRFREVLSADVKTREEILKQLFRTDRFASITEFLKTRRAQLDRQIRESLDRRAGVLQGAGAETREELDGLELAARERMEEQAALRDAAKVVADAATAALEAGRSADAALAERIAAQSALETLETRADAVAEKRTELAAARSAQAVEAAWQMRETRTRELMQARADAQRAEEALPAAQAALDTTCELLEEAQTAERDEREVTLLETHAMQAARRADDAERLAKARSAAAEQERRLHKAQAHVDAAREQAHAARESAAGLEAAWRRGRAAALAATLAEGEPCPVCGSEHHPHPATDGQAVEDAALDAARTLANDAASALAAAEATAAAASEALEAAQARIVEEEATVGELATADPVAVRSEAAALAAHAAQRRSEIAKATADLESCRERRDAAQAALAHAQAARDSAAARVTELDAALGTAADELASALRGAGIDSEEAYLARRRTPAQIDALDSEVQSFGRDLAAARDRLARATVAAEKVAAAPDLAALAAAERDAQSALAVATRSAIEAEKDRERYQQAIDAIEQIQAQSAELHAQHASVARLADVAEGSNPLKLSFQRYVLGAYLDEVLVHASYRLQHMTGGRYRLQRATEVKHKGRAAGLDLAIYDEQTDRTRPASTLSGGEGFMASLALALGLAEAVQSHAGGVKLETIFVDEGFGTLDPESLDSAITMLLELAGVQAGAGRLVGIISHVPELQQQIDARLEVSRTDRGSTARFVV